MFNAFGRIFGGGAGATPAEVAASRAAARAAAGGSLNPFDDPTLIYRDPNNQDSSSDEEDAVSDPPPPPPPRHAVPPRLTGHGFPPNLPPFPVPQVPAATSGHAAATGPPADAAPSLAGAPSTLDPTAAATAAEVAAAAAAAGIDLRPRRHRTPEERAARDHAKLLASLRSIGIPLAGRGTVQRTLKPDAVKNLPEFYGATSLQGVRTEQDVTEWVEHFISYMETQKDSCRAVVDLKQDPKETSKAYILRGRRTLQQVSTLYSQVRRARAIPVDGSSSTSTVTTPLPELQECLFLTILEGGLLPGLRQQMCLQTHSRFNEEEMVASLQRIERTIVLSNKENLLTAHGVNSANFMPPQHGSDSSPSADYIDDDPSLNSFSNFDDNQFFDSYSNFDDDAASFNVYGNLNNSNRNGSGRRTYRDTRQSDNSRSQRAPTRQGGNSAQRFAPSAGAASAHAPSHDHRQQRSRRCRRHYRSTPAANFEAARKTHTASPTAAVSTTLVRLAPLSSARGQHIMALSTLAPLIPTRHG
ncbi:hypothetical protein JKP88DRAFT_252938 [Tribonema minus]|uniref:Uncharacterized protein n=1 Tax=Tribonema minus TaxID=303371 RepID=A0A835Z985_9STRA|nr:hypothetical protein JKP88DRAFT_252938 [Tribonema minus]